MIPFKRQMEKAIKGYLSPLGFKYFPKEYIYIRYYSDDIVQSIRYADETHSKPRYYFLRTAIGVGSLSLAQILGEVTNGLRGNYIHPTGPAYFLNNKDIDNPFDDTLYIHSEFIGDRPMEENIADFDRMFKEDAQLIFDKYITQKAIFLCPITDPFFNQIHSLDNWFYVPLAYFFNSEFIKAFEFIKERLEIVEYLINEFGLNETNIETLEIYRNYSQNLTKWINDRRIFKVDDEYLPIYESSSNTIIDNYNIEIQNYIKKLLSGNR